MEKRRTSLAKSITIATSLLFLISMILVVVGASVLSYIMAYKNAETMVKDKVEYYSQTVEDWMKLRIDQLLTVKEQFLNLPEFMQNEEGFYHMLKVSTDHGQEFGVIADYIVLKDDGSMICGDGWVPEEGYDPRGNDYYTGAWNSQDLYISSPYIDATTNEFVVTVSTPFSVNGEVLGVLARDFVITAVQDIFDSYVSDDGSSIFLIDSDGNILSHKNKDFKPSGSRVVNISSVKDETLTKTNDQKPIVVRDYATHHMLSMVKKEPMSSWTIGISYPAINLMFPAFMTIIITFSIYIIVSGITSIIVAFIIKKKLNPVNDVLLASKKMQHGEFDINLEIKKNDEIGDIILAFNDTSNYLRSVIKEISRVLNLMAVGDLTVKSQGEFRGDFVDVKKSIDTIIAGIRKLLSEIGDLSKTVTSSSMQVANHSMDLSASVNEQSNQIDEIQKRIDAISDVIGQNVHECNEASKNTFDVSNRLQVSNEHMTMMVKAMSDITGSSEQIKKINKTIEDMAMQTNILSINASVEASHAGSHGKGFAVVADEVNSFANQCSDAAQDTSGLVDSTIVAVNRGSTLANETAESLKQVVDLAKTVASEIEQIAKLSTTQQEEIEAIRDAVNKMAKSINHEISSAEEGAATSEELSAQAQIMQDTLKLFKL